MQVTAGDSIWRVRRESRDLAGCSPVFGFAGADGFAALTCNHVSALLQFASATSGGYDLQERHDRKDNSWFSFKEHKRSKFKNPAMVSPLRGTNQEVE